MKRIIIALVFLTAALANAEAHRGYSTYATVSVETFYDELSPFGEWIQTPEYGYSWRPYLDDPEGFRPYATRGEWVYSDLGWTWSSDYPWGWATFHYGRWYLDHVYGWMWIPGSEWAPAWVTWGTYNDCWAWAPMGPAVQVSFNLNWRAPHSWWTVVPRGHFCASNWYDYRYSQPVHISQIIVINNIYHERHQKHGYGNWYNGPRVSDVEHHAKNRIRRIDMTENQRAVPRSAEVKRSSEVNTRNTRFQPSTRTRPAIAVETRKATTRSNANERARESVRNTPARETVKRAAPAQRNTERTSTERTRSERPAVREKPGNH